MAQEVILFLVRLAVEDTAVVEKAIEHRGNGSTVDELMWWRKKRTTAAG